MSQYYYTDGKERYGPYTLDELKSKSLSHDTLVWKEGLVDWMPARNIAELESLFASASGFPPPVAAPYANQPVYEAPPKNWLIESILVTILCCLPLGIVGIIYSTKVDTLWSAGQRDEARKYSREAGKWVKIGFFLGLGVIVLYLIFMVLGVVASIGAGMEV